MSTSTSATPTNSKETTGSPRAQILVRLAIFLVILVAMYGFLSPAFRRLRETVGDGTAPVDQGTLDRALAAPGPMIGAGIGFLGILLILWLMVLKPF